MLRQCTVKEVKQHNEANYMSFTFFLRPPDTFEGINGRIAWGSGSVERSGRRRVINL